MHLLVNELNEDEGYWDVLVNKLNEEEDEGYWDVELSIVFGTIWGTIYKEEKYDLRRMSQLRCTHI